MDKQIFGSNNLHTMVHSCEMQILLELVKCHQHLSKRIYRFFIVNQWIAGKEKSVFCLIRDEVEVSDVRTDVSWHFSIFMIF